MSGLKMCGEGDVLAAVQQSPSRSICRIFGKTVVGLGKRRIYTKIVFLCVTFKEYNTPHKEIRATMFYFANSCNHHYKLCLTFCSLVSLSLPEVVLPTKRFTLFGMQKATRGSTV